MQRSLTTHRLPGVPTKLLGIKECLITAASMFLEPVKRSVGKKFMFVVRLFPLNCFAGRIAVVINLMMHQPALLAAAMNHKKPPVILYL